jgi:sugar phosphate isomerase/epimerase
MLNKDSAGEIREFCRKTGMVPWSVHSGHLNAPGKAALSKYLRTQTHCAEITRALAAKVMVCHIPNVEPRAAAPDRDIDVLTRVADITRAHGLILAIETYPADYIIKLADAINREDVGINLDTGHSYLYDSKDVASVARKIGKRLVTTHIQDNFGAHDDHQPAGLGKIDWLSTLKAIKKTGYSGPLMMELTGNGPKNHRSTENLRTFDLEKEIIFAAAYIQFLWRKTSFES